MRILKQNSGMHVDRLRREAEERRFAEAWNKVNKTPGQHGEHTLAQLMHPPQSPNIRPAELKPRDYLVAATVIQWLGSAIGQFFLSELGYERAEPRGPHERR